MQSKESLTKAKKVSNVKSSPGMVSKKENIEDMDEFFDKLDNETN